MRRRVPGEKDYSAVVSRLKAAGINVICYRRLSH